MNENFGAAAGDSKAAESGIGARIADRLKKRGGRSKVGTATRETHLSRVASASWIGDVKPLEIYQESAS